MASLHLINIASLLPPTSTVMVQNAIDHRFFIVMRGLSAMLWSNRSKLLKENL
ncbi:hypothetical protein Y788_00400 [Pantoea dispersa 625]|nr:hypothetical protein Y788_00400 [Pantoea dispersa 625]